MRFEVVDEIEAAAAENFELSENFFMGKKNVSRLLAENMPRGYGHGFTRLRVTG